MKYAREVIVTVTMDDREILPIRLCLPDVICTQQAYRDVVNTDCGREKSEVEDPLCLYDDRLTVFCDNSAMEFLERNIFRYSKECYKEKREQSGYMWLEIQKKKR